MVEQVAQMDLWSSRYFAWADGRSWDATHDLAQLDLRLNETLGDRPDDTLLVDIATPALIGSDTALQASFFAGQKKAVSLLARSQQPDKSSRRSRRSQCVRCALRSDGPQLHRARTSAGRRSAILRRHRMFRAPFATFQLGVRPRMQRTD